MTARFSLIGRLRVDPVERLDRALFVDREDSMGGRNDIDIHAVRELVGELCVVRQPEGPMRCGAS